MFGAIKTFLLNLVANIVAKAILKKIMIGGLIAVGIAAGPAGWIITLLFLMVTVKNFWLKVKSFFRRIF